jgi:hypothetical protein
MVKEKWQTTINIPKLEGKGSRGLQKWQFSWDNLNNIQQQYF